MSLQQLTAAIVAGTQETTLALASLHFDFSLCKVEAPSEFKLLGQELTPSRREAAEEGTPHITARKLGALFQQGLPPTDSLFKAYGTRASEIASRRDVNPRASRSDGLFANLVGIDGTNIWAAATSGPGAIAVHLLACMLARMWSVSEAISIWVELVAERKKELEAVKDISPEYHQSQAASRISLSREQLAEWDASARAWLRAADEAMQSKQKQLTIILNNVEVPVNKKPGLYGSVIDAWKSAMIAVDRLVQGMPQSIQDGSALLGLSSWHLYPDILVLGATEANVKLSDSLVAEGALLTIGLQIVNEKHGSVYWCLPLSHFRYYGGAVMSKRSLITQGNRITVPQLFQITVGSITKHWGLSLVDIASMLASLWEYISPIASDGLSRGTLHWLYQLSQALKPIISSSDVVEKKICEQLVRFGARRCPNFIFPANERAKVLELFGLTNFDTLFSLLTLEGKIKFLRKIAEDIPGMSFIIQYKDPSQVDWAFATAIPKEGGHVFGSSNSKRHLRWLHIVDNVRAGEIQRLGEDVTYFSSQKVSIHRGHSDKFFSWREKIQATFKTQKKAFQQNPEDFDEASDLFVLDEELSFEEHLASYAFFAGDLTQAGMFVKTRGQSSSHEVEASFNASIDDLAQAMRQELLSRKRLLDYLDSFVHQTSLMRSLRALATVDNIYKTLPDATISMEVTGQAVFTMPWVPNDQDTRYSFDFSRFEMDWSRVFACIVLFESGTLAVQPDLFKRVMAMSVGDSLYIAAPLLSDPSDIPAQNEVRRIRGNVGKPGIAMLIPPENPQVKELEAGNWHLINHAPFEGQEEDAFQGTSLHLSFTGYTVPVELGVHGYRDAEIYFLESVVSIHDRGHWVADIDVLRHFYASGCTRIFPPICSHGKTGKPPIYKSSHELTCIDNWNELLDRPENAGIVRAKGNWIGRLSAMVLSLQLHYPTTVLPPDFCWECADKRMGLLQVKKDGIVVC